jgi:hypothetical protein
MSIGDTTTRLSRIISRSLNGWNIGTAGASTETSNPSRRTLSAKERSTAATKSGALRRRLS